MYELHQNAENMINQQDKNNKQKKMKEEHSF